MNTLFIVISLIATGKIEGQLTDIPGAINEHISSSFPVVPRNLPLQARFYAITPPRNLLSPISVQRVTSIDRSEPNDKFDLNLSPLTPRENHPERRPFIPQRTPDGMNQPEKSKTETNQTSPDQNVGHSANHVNSDRYNPTRLNGAELNMTVSKPEAPLKPKGFQNEQSTNWSKERNETAISEKPLQPIAVDKAAEGNVTLDGRASFDGDKCPTGTVRFNDMCVKKD